MKKMLVIIIAVLMTVLFTSCQDNNGNFNIKTTATALDGTEALAIIEAWLEEHPFQLGSDLDAEYDEYTADGEDYFHFYVGITRLGIADILVHQKTGEIFYCAYPGHSELEPVDDWYFKEHAGSWTDKEPTVPDEEQALHILSKLLAAQLTEGFSLLVNGEGEVNGQHAFLFGLGKNTPEKFTTEEHYAVTDDGDIWLLDIAANEWKPAAAG